MTPDATRIAMSAWAAGKTRAEIRAKAKAVQEQADRMQSDAAGLQRRASWLRRLADEAPAAERGE